MSEKWYVARGGERYGPYSWVELQGYAQKGVVARQDQVWSEATGDWLPAEGIAGLFPLEAAAGTAVRSRRRVLAMGGGLLALLVIAAVAFLVFGRDARDDEAHGIAGVTPEAPLMPGATLTLEGGVSVFAPTGALPEAVQISARLSDEPPLLPEGVLTVGQALLISADAQPQGPVFLRLPAPAGVDASELVIVRVEGDGATTLLFSELEDDQLVAATPGFSAFVIGRLEERAVRGLSGKGHLLPGEKATYRVSLGAPGEARGATWKVDGGARIVYENDDAVTIEAGQEVGAFTLSYECLSVTRGVRWYGARAIAVTKDSPDLQGGFLVTAVTRTPSTRPERLVYISASVHGEYEGPISWTWDFGDGERGAQTTGPLVSSIALPEHHYKTERVERYAVTVTATDNQQRQAKYVLAISVEPQPFEVLLKGPDRLAWQPGGVRASYTATPSAGKPPYAFGWGLLPSKRSERHIGETSTQEVAFDEPGGHLLALLVTDVRGSEGSLLYPVQVTGGDPLSVHIVELPAEAEVNAEVGVRVEVRGGVLVVNGKKGGYTVRVNWGDGGESVVLRDVGLDRPSPEGAEVVLTHRYAEPRDYSVTVRVMDAVSNDARDGRQIAITPPKETVYGTARLLGGLDDFEPLMDGHAPARMAWCWGNKPAPDPIWIGCNPEPLVSQLVVQFEVDLDSRKGWGAWSGSGTEQPSNSSGSCSGMATGWFEGELEPANVGVDEDGQGFRLRAEGWTTVSIDADLFYRGVGVKRGVEASRKGAETLTLRTIVDCEWREGVGRLRVYTIHPENAWVVSIALKDPPFEIVR